MLEAVAAPIPPLSGGDSVTVTLPRATERLANDRPDELLSLLDALGRLNNKRRKRG